MKQNKQEQWEKNLDMYWRKSFLSNVSDVNGRDYDSLKQFISALLSQTRQEAVEEVLEEVIKYLEEMEIVLTPEQSGKHNYDQMENEYFKGRNMGILRCIDLLKSLSQEKK